MANKTIGRVNLAPRQSDSSSNEKLLQDPMLGQVIDDRYELKELIGIGAWGNVYLASNLTLGTDVAVKIIHKHVLKDENAIKRFHREARLLSHFETNNVIKVIDADISPVPYIVMEYFDGTPLNKWIRQNGQMNPEMAISLFIQLCQALGEAEAMQIVHRDLKPSNILIRTNGNSVEAKILDFGLAKCLDLDSTCGGKITATGDILGSPPYMAPEQCKGQSDTRSDIYALGCIIYEMLSGRPAFSSKNSLDYLHLHLTTTPPRISALDSELRLPAGLEEIIFKCIEKSPKKRYQSGILCRLELDSIESKLKPNSDSGRKASLFKTARDIIFGSAALVILMSVTQSWWHQSPSLIHANNKIVATRVLQ